MMAKTLSLGLVIHAVGFSQASQAVGTVGTRIQAIGEAIDKSTAAVQKASTGMIDEFAKQKAAVEKTRAELEQYKEKTTELGRELAGQKRFQAEATEALSKFQAELAGQTSPATDAQKLKLKLLREQLTGADSDVKKLNKEFKDSREESIKSKEAFMAQAVSLDRLRDRLNQNGISTRNLDEHRRRLRNTIETEQHTVERLTQRYNQLKAAQDAHANARADMNSRIGDVAAAYGMGRMLHAPIGAFVRQDDALNRLQVTMMDHTGKVNEAYGALRAQVVQLGNDLPGTTADFAGTANALLEQGVALKSVLGGGLQAAAHLAVVLRIPADAAGEMTAKLREGYKLSDDELPKMADSMQRAKFAFGMKPSDLMATASYQAPMLNQLRITGLENVDKMHALQGLGANVGLEGSSFGTNFSMMLARLAKGPLMVEEAKKGMKAEARHIMEKLHIKFNFFDKKGNFAGLDNMVKELEKLKIIRNKLGDKAALEVSEAMFGAEAGRPAMIIAEAGVKGYQEAQQKMADQASLQDRIKKALESTRNTWDALTGSVENFGAAAAGPAVQALHPLINTLNSAAGAMTEFTEKHPEAAKWIGLTAISVIGGAVALLSLGTALSVVRFAWAGARLLPGMMSLGSGALWLGRALGGVLAGGLRIAGQALLFMGRALLMNPIGLAVTVIAGAAYLIYRNWNMVKPFFVGLWNEVRTAFDGGITGIGKLLINWSPLGLFHKALAGVLEYFGVKLPSQFTDYGSMIVGGLIDGIESRFNAAKATLQEFGENIKGWFASTLGIKSPSRVFMAFGGNIGEGAAIGISNSVSRVQGAVGKLSGAALSGVSSASQKLDAMRAGGAAGGGKFEITYSPTVQIQGGGGDVAGQVKEGLGLSLRELEQMIQRLVQEQTRRAYS